MKTTYTAYFRTDARFAERDFDADTPEQALRKARNSIHRHANELCFESYDMGQRVDEIAITDEDGFNDIVVWQDDELRLRLAAPELLAAAELVVARWERGDLAEAVRQLEAAIATAKAGAQ